MKLVWPLFISLMLHFPIVYWKPVTEIERTGHSQRAALNIQQMKFVTAQMVPVNEEMPVIKPVEMITEDTHEESIHEVFEVVAVEDTVSLATEKLKPSAVIKEPVKKLLEKPKEKTRKVEKKKKAVKASPTEKERSTKVIEKKIETEKIQKKVVEETNEEEEKEIEVELESEKVDEPVETVAKHESELLSEKEEVLEVVSTIDSTVKSRGFDEIPTMSEPRYRNAFPPEYPRIARKRGQQGLVLLRAKVDLNGAVKRVELVQSSGVKSLDNRALETVEKWVFYPYTVAEKPTVAWVNIPVEFSLKK